MPTTITVPGVGDVNFADDWSHEEIDAYLRDNYQSMAQQAPPQDTSRPLPASTANKDGILGNLWSGVKQGFGEGGIPYVSQGKQLVDATQLLLASKRAQAGQATDEDIAKIRQYQAEQDQERADDAARSTSQTIAHGVGRLLGNLPGFAGELATTGGLGSAGERAALKTTGAAVERLAGKAAAESLAKATEEGAAISAKGLANRILGKAGATAAQMPVARGLATAAKAEENMTPELQLESQPGGTMVTTLKEGDPFAKAAYKALGDQYTEVFTEHIGGILEDGLGLAAKTVGLQKPMDYLKGMKQAVAARFIEKYPGLANNNTFIDKLRRNTEWNGMLGEMLEERAGEVMKAGLGIEPYTPPTPEQLAIEAIGFGLSDAGWNTARLAKAMADSNGGKVSKAGESILTAVAQAEQAKQQAPKVVEAAASATGTPTEEQNASTPPPSAGNEGPNWVFGKQPEGTSFSEMWDRINSMPQSTPQSMALMRLRKANGLSTDATDAGLGEAVSGMGPTPVDDLINSAAQDRKTERRRQQQEGNERAKQARRQSVEEGMYQPTDSGKLPEDDLAMLRTVPMLSDAATSTGVRTADETTDEPTAIDKRIGENLPPLAPEVQKLIGTVSAEIDALQRQPNRNTVRRDNLLSAIPEATRLLNARIEQSIDAGINPKFITPLIDLSAGMAQFFDKHSAANAKLADAMAVVREESQRRVEQEQRVNQMRQDATGAFSVPPPVVEKKTRKRKPTTKADIVGPAPTVEAAPVVEEVAPVPATAPTTLNGLYSDGNPIAPGDWVTFKASDLGVTNGRQARAVVTARVLRVDNGAPVVEVHRSGVKGAASVAGKGDEKTLTGLSTVTKVSEPRSVGRPRKLSETDSHAADALIEAARQSGLYEDYALAHSDTTANTRSGTDAADRVNSKANSTMLSALEAARLIDGFGSLIQKYVTGREGALGLAPWNEKAAHAFFTRRVKSWLLSRVNNTDSVTPFNESKETITALKSYPEHKQAGAKSTVSIDNVAETETSKDDGRGESEFNNSNEPAVSGEASVQDRGTSESIFVGSLKDPEPLFKAIAESEEQKGGKKLDAKELALVVFNSVKARVGAVVSRLKGKSKTNADAGIRHLADRIHAEIGKVYEDEGLDGLEKHIRDNNNELFASDKAPNSGIAPLVEGVTSLEKAMEVLLAHVGYDSFLRKFADLLITKGINPNVHVLSDAEFNRLDVDGIENETAFYDSHSAVDTIYIRQSAISHDYLLAHEAAHAATVWALRNNAEFSRDISKLRDVAASKLGDRFYGLMDHGSEFANLAEFVADAYSSHTFREALSRVTDTTGMSLWERFKELVARVLGLSGEAKSVLDRIMELSSEQFHPNKGEAAGDLFAGKSSAVDAKYMDLASRYEAGDKSVLQELQQMVREAAMAAGYTIGPVWHSTDKTFDVWDMAAKKQNGFDSGDVAAFTASPELARKWTTRLRDRGATTHERPFYLRITNAVTTDSAASFIKRNAQRRAHDYYSYTTSDGSAAFSDVSAEPWRTLENRSLLADMGADGGFFDENAGRIPYDPAPVWFVTDPSQIKSADPITRDAAGNIIPLSQRFNDQSNSILYAGQKNYRNSAARPYISADDVAAAMAIPREDGKAHIETIAKVQQNLIPAGIAKAITDTLMPTDIAVKVEDIESETNEDRRRNKITQYRNAGFDYYAFRKSPQYKALRSLRGILNWATLTDSAGAKLDDLDTSTDAGAALKREAAVVVDRAAGIVEGKLSVAQREMQRLLDEMSDPHDSLLLQLEQLKDAKGVNSVSAQEAVAAFAKWVHDTKVEAAHSGASEDLLGVDYGARAKRSRSELAEIGRAIAAVAKGITDDELRKIKTHDELLQLIRSKGLLQNNVMSQELLPADGSKGVFSTYRGLLPAVRHLKELQTNHAEAVAGINAYKAELQKLRGTKKDTVTPEGFLNFYSKLVTHLNKVKDITSKIEERKQEADKLTLQVEALRKVITSPEYVNNRTSSVMTLNKMVHAIEGRIEGHETIYKVAGEEFRISNAVNTPAAYEENSQTYAKMLSKIDGELSKDDLAPELRQSYLWLKARTEMEAADRLDGGVWFGGTDVLQWMRRIYFFRDMIPASLPAWLVRGRLGAEMRAVQTALDTVTLRLRKVRNHERYGRRAVLLASDEAVKSHAADMPTGLNPEQQRTWWIEKVLEPVLSQNQDVKRDTLRAGDYTIHNVKVTAADVKAGELMAKWNDEVRKVLESVSGAASAFPTRIIEGEYSRLPFASGSMTVTRTMNRHETDTGTSDSPMDLAKRWLKSNATQRDAMLQEPAVFNKLVLSYVSELNNEFIRKNQYAGQYQQLARKWRKEGNHPETFDALLKQISKENETDDRALAITDGITEYVNRFLQEAKTTGADNVSDIEKAVGKASGAEATVLSQLDAENSFRKPRTSMVAPSSFYVYELASPQSFGAVERGSTLYLTIRQLKLMQAIQENLRGAIDEMKGKRDPKSWTPMLKEMVNLNKGNVNYTLSEAIDLQRRIARAQEHLQGAIAVRPASSESRGIWSVLSGFIKQQMLSSVTSLTNNFFIGSMSSRWAADAVLRGAEVGMAKTPTYPFSVLKDAVVVTALNRPAVRKWMEEHGEGVFAPFVKHMAEAMQVIQRAESFGGDEESGFRQHMDALKLGYAPFAKGLSTDSLGAQRLGQFLTKPGLRHIDAGMAWLIGSQENLTNALSTMYFDRALRKYFGQLNQIYTARQEQGKPLEGRFTASELSRHAKLSVEAWARGLALFSTNKSVEDLVLDYRKRVEAAKASGANTELVPFTEDQDIYDDVVGKLSSLNNLPLRSNRPDLVRNRTAYGDFAREAILFPGWANGWLNSVQFMNMVSRQRSLPGRAGISMYQTGLLIAAMMAMGLSAGLVRSLVYRLLYGRPYPVETFADLARNPDVATAARVGGGALALSIPYVGEYIAQAMGAQNYKPDLLNLANLSLPAKMGATLYNAARDYINTNDGVGAAATIARTAAPGLTPIINRLPAISERNALADAVRVARVNRGEIEVSDRVGSGSGTQPTEFSNLVNRSVAAAASGDMDLANKLRARAIEVKAKAGDKNPEGAYRSAVQSRTPDMKAFGRKLTEEEKASVLGRMSPGQREIYNRAENAVTTMIGASPVKSRSSSGGGSKSTGPIAAINKKFRTLRSNLTPKSLKDMRSRLLNAKPKLNVSLKMTKLPGSARR